ncbi:MAG: NAD(+)/NADH kinase [Ruminococcaceae bacterium]|nr:NAD(+)/NADH kinase [Oscillospiraceae bacterium]
MRVILSSNPYRDRGMKAAQQAQRILERMGAECCFCLPFELGHGNHADLPRHLKFSNLQQELAHADMLICFGGDGTILHAAKDATTHNVPILGVNMGSVGFMAELEEGELSQLERLASGDYTTEERMMLQVRVFRSKQVVFDEYALNDAVLSKGTIARVAELDVSADGVLICQLSGDGVVVATPTGSTAYSMSAGGPIVEPSSDNLVVTPVCAHQLSARSMVIAPERTITVQLPRRSRKSVYLSVDGGKAMRISGNDRVEIRRAQCRTRLVKLSGKNFYQLLNQKLGGYVL